MGKRVRVLYVCPFAHYTGHPPWAAIHEPEALARAGAEVKLLTFYGIIDETKVKVPHLTVLPRVRFTRSLQRVISFLLTRWSVSRWLLMFLENFWTLAVAIRLKRKLKYDIIHLRDGDPFLFIPFLFSLFYRGYNWVVSLMGGKFFYTPLPLFTTLRKEFRLFVYTIALKVLNSNLWRPLYRRALARNNFLFLTQSEAVKRDYDSYLQGVFSGKVFCLMMGHGSMAKVVSKEEARQRLDLPPDKPLFLSFGTCHPGKDLGAVFRALKDMPDVFLAQAGKYTFSVGPNPEKLARDYAVRDRVIIRSSYISEEEKPYYFFAADAVILSYTKQFSSTASLLWDACHFGTPVIASDSGQLGELVEAFQVGLPFRVQDADSLSKAVKRFISLKPEAIKKFKDNCRRFCDEFSIDKWAQGCLEIYDSLLSGKGVKKENS
jgi:glycosyltransferase involved in cell wall biosynthesis